MSFAYNETFDREELALFLEDCDPDTKIYIGCDSKVVTAKKDKQRKTFIDYVAVVIVHKAARNGCRVFAVREHIEDKSHNLRKNPTQRLLTEVQKAGELYQSIQDLILDFEVEIHLDLNPDERFKSSTAAKAALGYIRSFDDLGGHFEAKIKPDSFAATHAADRLFRGKLNKKANRKAARKRAKENRWNTQAA